MLEQMSETYRTLYYFVCEQLGKESGDKWAEIVIENQTNTAKENQNEKQ